MVEDGRTAHDDVVPADALAALAVYHADAHKRFVSLESRAHEVSLRIGAHGVVEERIVPSFLRP